MKEVTVSKVKIVIVYKMIVIKIKDYSKVLKEVKDIKEHFNVILSINIEMVKSEVVVIYITVPDNSIEVEGILVIKKKESFGNFVLD